MDSSRCNLRWFRYPFAVTYLNMRCSTNPISFSSISTTYPCSLTLQMTMFPYHCCRTFPDKIRIHLLLGRNGARCGVIYAINFAGFVARGPLRKLGRYCFAGGFTSASSLSICVINNQWRISRSSGVTRDVPLPCTGTGTTCVPEHLPSKRSAFGVALYFCKMFSSTSYSRTILVLTGMLCRISRERTSTAYDMVVYA